MLLVDGGRVGRSTEEGGAPSIGVRRGRGSRGSLFHCDASLLDTLTAQRCCEELRRIELGCLREPEEARFASPAWDSVVASVSLFASQDMVYIRPLADLFLSPDNRREHEGQARPRHSRQDGAHPQGQASWCWNRTAVGRAQEEVKSLLQSRKSNLKDVWLHLGREGEPKGQLSEGAERERALAREQ